jgi:hypothetical protein
MKESYGRGVANHPDSESCMAAMEAWHVVMNGARQQSGTRQKPYRCLAGCLTKGRLASFVLVLDSTPCTKDEFFPQSSLPLFCGGTREGEQTVIYQQPARGIQRPPEIGPCGRHPARVPSRLSADSRGARCNGRRSDATFGFWCCSHSSPDGGRTATHPDADVRT